MIKSINRQRSYTFALISVVAFVLITSAAFINYFNDSGKISGWMDIDDALENAKSSKKPVIVNFYSRFNQMSKNINNQILSNESVKKFLNDNFEMAGINVADKQNTKYLDSIYNIKSIPAYLIIAPNQDELFRFTGNEAMNVMGTFALEKQQKDIMNDINYFINMPENQTAKSIAKDSDKLLLYLSVVEPENARKMMFILDGMMTRDYINKEFVPVYLNSSNKYDKKLINELKEKYISTNQPLNDDRESIKLSVGDFVEEFILVLDKDENYVSHFNPKVSLYDDEAMKTKLENIYNKYKNKEITE